MPRLTATITRGDRSAFDAYYRNAIQTMEQAALRATDRAAAAAVRHLRDQMRGAGMGRLGQAIGQGSDAKAGRGAKQFAGGGFSASGHLHLRSRSERTRGAIEAATAATTTIRPVRSRWLWIPTSEVQRVAGGRNQRKRVTPGNWTALGLQAKLGPLVRIQGIDGRPLLVVEQVGVSSVGARGGRARSLTKKGAPRKGDRLKQVAVMFVAVPSTTRAARVDASQIITSEQAALPRLFEEELRKRNRNNG